MSPPQPTSLPPPKVFLTSLFSTYPKSSSLSSNPISTTESPILSTAAKPTLLTLHALFPTLLLPALDLLDRRLVTRFILRADPANGFDDAEEKSEHGIAKTKTMRVVYYVKSNTHRDGRSRYSRSGDVGGTSYQVRTGAWSCTCAAFTFSAYNEGGGCPTYETHQTVDGFRGHGVSSDGDEDMLDVPETEGTIEKDGAWQWGGLMMEDEDVPLCKHLLACVLVEKWDVGESMVDERMVGRGEMAGWAAGWEGEQGRDQSI